MPYALFPLHGFVKCYACAHTFLSKLSEYPEQLYIFSVSLRLKRLALLLVWLSQNFSLFERNTTNSSWGTNLVFFSFLIPSLPFMQAWGISGAHSSRGHERNESQSRWYPSLYCAGPGAWLIARVSEHVLSHECKHLWMTANEVTGGLRLLWKSACATLPPCG